MSQPQQLGGAHPQYREYQPSYSPGHHRPTQSASPRALAAPNAQLPGPQGSSSPLSRLSPVQTQFGLSAGYLRANSPATPVMAQAYNPQQWTQSQMGFQRVLPVAVSTREATGMEAAMPSPPPPYTPDDVPARPSALREQRTYTASPTALEASSSVVVSPVAVANSPAVRMSPSFPPPPNAQSSRNRERSASGNRIFNTLQTFTGRGKQPATNETMGYPQYGQQVEDVRPPAARRAASAGHIPVTGSPSSGARSRQNSSARPSGTLPGPPPGPPPTGSRSQSLNRYATPSSSQTVEAAPVRRTAQGSSLGPVPPTPANWVDGDSMPESEVTSAQPYQPLRIHTGGMREQSLTRRPATRDSSAQGLRERRSRSKAARDGYDEEPMSAIEPVAAASSGTISQRREHSRKISSLADPNMQSPSMLAGPANVLTPPYTPAVGRQALGSASSDRPATRDGAISAKLPSNIDVFYKQALERHRQFLEKEANAASDAERLEAFANYMVHESRLRRDRYQAAYNGMAGDIVDLTRDMWRSYSRTSRKVATPNTATSHGPSSSTSEGFPTGQADDSSTGEYTPATENGSIDGDLDQAAGKQWGETFKPSLSPIPSMAVSSAQDDSSRGRAPSRWWEKSEASGSIGKPERIEKSHRETKYMGINPALLRSSPQLSPEVSRLTPTPGASTFALAADEYPPEKVGWHEQHDVDTPMATPGYDTLRKRPHTNTPDQMDLSRLVTLPPPYPRHHPAINNNHPSLAGLRNEHRQLANNEEVQRIRDAFIDQDWARRRAHQEEAKKRRTKMRQSTQEKLNEGDITFAEAAQAEAKFEEDEVERSKTNARALFDAFEASVSHPLNTLITKKLADAEKCMMDLQSALARNNESSDPNRAQEEGDEHPERLEKLTLLRWLFDAREVLHKEMFDLHAQRAEKYDGRQRTITFYKESLKRCELFLAQIEGNVNSGVEDQVSAFWDIAPALKELVQQIPGVIEDGEEHLQLLDHFRFFVPPQEIQENPAYRRYPGQYLYSVLSHAEKSTYQFIESQVNLWCMLHAVREMTAEASLKVIELETGNGAELAGEISQAKSAEERRMTADLQEKVGEVERQWKEALGTQLEDVRAGVKQWLEATGGWEEGLDG
ncbi:hypothetical protein AMS68_004714 [Peltaster fructicola]|uniref:Uncharacterized protein n=1 Tax=Peltaster fructicola TaxID=286661 RepID=A0A6H0XWQ2_9PEZI|nr:hypothetical protein AMS68_004714 [Peltaster fructicola]